MRNKRYPVELIGYLKSWIFSWQVAFKGFGVVFFDSISANDEGGAAS